MYISFLANGSEIGCLDIIENYKMCVLLGKNL